MLPKDVKISPVLEATLLRYAKRSLPLNSNSRETKQLAAPVKIISDEHLSSDDSFKGNLFSKQALRNAYLVYYLPANLVKLFPVLDELFSPPEISGLGGTEISILDLGCGPGTFLLAALEYLAAEEKGRRPRLPPAHGRRSPTASSGSRCTCRAWRAFSTWSGRTARSDA